MVRAEPAGNMLGMLKKDLTRFMSLSWVRQIRARERTDMLAGFGAGDEKKKKDWKCRYKLFLTAKSSPKASSICFTPNVPRKWSIGDAATTAYITAVASKTRWTWVPDSVTGVIPGWHGKQTPVPVGKSDSTIYLTQQVFVPKKVPVVIRK